MNNNLSTTQHAESAAKAAQPVQLKADPIKKPASVGRLVQMQRSSGVSGRDVIARVLGTSSPVQHKGGSNPTSTIHALASHGISGSGGKMPHAHAIQHSFGRHDIGSISAHTGSRAAEANSAMGSEAYATGNSVAFAGGSPSLHTAAHEAAHIIQQRSGSVQLKGGVGQVGDRYERHADAVADLVVQGKSAESLLDQYSGGSSGGAVQHQLLQHKGGGLVGWFRRTFGGGNQREDEQPLLGQDNQDNQSEEESEEESCDNIEFEIAGQTISLGEGAVEASGSLAKKEWEAELGSVDLGGQMQLGTSPGYVGVSVNLSAMFNFGLDLSWQASANGDTKTATVTGTGTAGVTLTGSIGIEAGVGLANVATVGAGLEGELSFSPTATITISGTIEKRKNTPVLTSNLKAVFKAEAALTAAVNAYIKAKVLIWQKKKKWSIGEWELAKWEYERTLAEIEKKGVKARDLVPTLQDFKDIFKKNPTDQDEGQDDVDETTPLLGN